MLITNCFTHLPVSPGIVHNINEGLDVGDRGPCEILHGNYGELQLGECIVGWHLVCC